MSTTFPTAPSFTGTTLMPPATFRPGLTADEKVDQLKSYLDGQFLALGSMQESIESGWLIDTVRILNLNADSITANTIFTQDLYLGAEQKVQLLGASNKIEIYDAQGTPELRVKLGFLGAGNTNYGIEAWDSSGSLIFSVGDSVFIDGAIITNATITNAKIIDVDGNKLTGSNFVSSGMVQANAITASKINVTSLSAISANIGTITAGTINATVSVNAGSINAGTLTVDGNPAISVTGSGACVFQSGGDIIMKASSSGDDTLIQLQTSSSSLRGEIGYNTSSDITYIRTDNGADLYLISDGKIVINPNNASIDLGASSSDDITFVGRVVGDILPNSSGSGNIGNASNKFALVRATTITSGDLRFENDFILIEPNELDPDADPYSGLAVMNSDYKQIGFLDKDGNLQVAGTIEEHVKFKKPKIKRKEYTDANKEERT